MNAWAERLVHRALFVNTTASQNQACWGRVHPWRVLHAAHGSADMLEAVTLQAEAGMRPEVLTLEGLADPDAQWASTAEPISHSLVSAWHDVRSWRDALVAAELARFELVHAHSFSAGMAAVRTCPVVLYEMPGFVEQLAIAASEHSNGERPGAWLSRSLRVAEQFVIARAGAVVVRSSDDIAGALERGAAADDVFLIPRSGLSPEETARRYDEAYHHASARREKTLTNRIAMSLAPLAV